MIFPDNGREKHATCYEGSYFAAYKVIEDGVVSMYKT